MTVRDRIRAALELRPQTSLEVSQSVGVAQGEVAGHLEHLARSLPHQGLVLEVQPARCIACEFTFEGRRRFARPSRCPQCRSERIDPPRFFVRPR
jgi:predicted Zn-ribbon and HTH transcriptional regulator